MTNELALKDKDLLDLYRADAAIGTEDAGESGVYPMVKITAALSKENILFDGSASHIGKLYHTELKQEFDSLKANICYIGRFMLPDFTTKEPKLTYVVGAVMADNRPFVMFVKGYSLQNMWQFLGEVGTLRNRFQIPMYPLSVTISSVERPHEKFKSVNVFKFSIERTKDGIPTLESDFNRASALKELASKFKEVAVTMTRSEEVPDEYIEQANRTERKESPMLESSEVEDINDQIPF